jgi:hypothetical protein
MSPGNALKNTSRGQFPALLEAVQEFFTRAECLEAGMPIEVIKQFNQDYVTVLNGRVAPVLNAVCTLWDIEKISLYADNWTCHWFEPYIYRKT